MAVEAGADAIGLIFWTGSKRAVGVERAQAITRALPPLVSTVGVFVDETPDRVRTVADAVGLSGVQLHGDEVVADWARFPRPVLKAIVDRTVRDQPVEDRPGGHPRRCARSGHDRWHGTHDRLGRGARDRGDATAGAGWRAQARERRRGSDAGGALGRRCGLGRRAGAWRQGSGPRAGLRAGSACGRCRAGTETMRLRAGPALRARPTGTQGTDDDDGSAGTDGTTRVRASRPGRPRVLRRVRRTVRARDARGSDGGAHRGVLRGAAGRGVHRRIRAAAATVRRAADAALRGAAALGGVRRRHDPAEARGPRAHRRAQDQQRARPGVAGPAHGQVAHRRRDRRRAARRRDRDRLRAARHAVRRLHGRGRHGAAGAQRVPHAHARRGGARRRLGIANAQGRDQRGDARLGRDRAGHLLPARVGTRAAPVPGDGARVPVGHR